MLAGGYSNNWVGHTHSGCRDQLVPDRVHHLQSERGAALWRRPVAALRAALRPRFHGLHVRIPTLVLRSALILLTLFSEFLLCADLFDFMTGLSTWKSEGVICVL